MSIRLLGLGSGAEGGVAQWGGPVKMPKNAGAGTALFLWINDLGTGPHVPQLYFLNGPTQLTTAWNNPKTAKLDLTPAGQVAIPDLHAQLFVVPFNYIYPWVDLIDNTNAVTSVAMFFDGQIDFSPAG